MAGKNRIELSLERIADAVAPAPVEIIGTPEIAKRLGCTTVWVAEMARKGDIPAACMVSGTGNGKPWKFYREKIEGWLVNRGRPVGQGPTGRMEQRQNRTPRWTMPRKPKVEKKTITGVVNSKPITVVLHPPTKARKSWYADWPSLVSSKSTGRAKFEDAVVVAEEMVRDGG
jgi:hypothetical protein